MEAENTKPCSQFEKQGFLVIGHFHPHLWWLMVIYIRLMWNRICYFVLFFINKSAKESQEISKILIFEGSRPEARGYRQRITAVHGQCWGLIFKPGHEGRGKYALTLHKFLSKFTHDIE